MGTPDLTGEQREAAIPGPTLDPEIKTPRGANREAL
jgi:hypothetical protein